MQSQNTKGKLQKPEGGYCSVSSATLGLLWWSLSEGLLSSWAVRVGLGLFELRLRRKAYIWTERKAGRGVREFVPHYSASELARLCGLPEKRARAALRELLELGVLAEFSPVSIRFACSLDEVKLCPEQRSAFRSWLVSLTKRRQVPIPRRVLVLACESSSRALIAAVLGISIRCSWLRPGEGFTFSGWVSCLWLSRLFRLSPRSIQSAKEHLMGLGWIERTGKVGRNGELVAINPLWDRLLGTTSEPVPVNGDTSGEQERRSEGAGGPDSERASGTNSAGVKEPSGTDSAEVSLIRESLPTEETKHQRESRPAARAENSGPGVLISGKGQEEKNTKTPTELPPPRLSKIRAEDFRDVGRALELFRQAVKCRLMPNDSEHSRLLWLAAIERARTGPAKNPAGVFLHIVKNRKWDYLSDGHFDAANARLKAHLHGPPSEIPRFSLRPALDRPSAPARPQLSRDALLLQVVKNELAKRGSRCDPFPLLRSQAGWNRTRFENAAAELENSPRNFAPGHGNSL